MFHFKIVFPKMDWEENNTGSEINYTFSGLQLMAWTRLNGLRDGEDGVRVGKSIHKTY